jgi:hypothetical protein
MAITLTLNGYAVSYDAECDVYRFGPAGEEPGSEADTLMQAVGAIIERTEEAAAIAYREDLATRDPVRFNDLVRGC